jgi:hypothetical protein
LYTGIASKRFLNPLSHTLARSLARALSFSPSPSFFLSAQLCPHEVSAERLQDKHPVHPCRRDQFSGRRGRDRQNEKERKPTALLLLLLGAEQKREEGRLRRKREKEPRRRRRSWTRLLTRSTASR